jgi:hypothetical protein
MSWKVSVNVSIRRLQLMVSDAQNLVHSQRVPHRKYSLATHRKGTQELM